MQSQKNKITISAIVAKAKHDIIGCNGDMPWRMPEDLKYFRQMTMGKPVIMGRKTWESLPGALKGRANLVLTRNPDYKADGAEVFTDPDAIVERALHIARKTNQDEIMVVGGGEVYRLLLDRCTRLYITRIEADLEGDTKFPKIVDGKGWDKIERGELKRLGKDQYRSERTVYERTPNLFDACGTTVRQNNISSVTAA